MGKKERELKVNYHNPTIIPTALIGKKKLKRMLKEGKLGHHTDFFFVSSDDDNARWSSHDGVLCMNYCSYLRDWGLSGESFDRWLDSLEHEVIEDTVSYEYDTRHEMALAYFDYYQLTS